MNHLYNKQNATLSIWLGLMCCAIIAMIFIGGLTRLTESGLSITEWNPVSGVLPPMNTESWNVEFDKYKKSPEYLKHNNNMGLEEFKSIYLLEFIHRIAGRIISLLYLLPLIFFYFKGIIKNKDLKIYLFALILLGLQGFMGWYMVQSGLISNPYVSHYRLASHLMLAVFLYIIIFWQMMKNSFDIMLVSVDNKLSSLKYLCLFSILILLIQITFGAFVAGLHAGLVYNNFPMMGDSFIPSEILLSNISIASFRDPIFVQFIHRITAYLLFAIISIFCIFGIKLGNNKLKRVIIYIFLALLFQIFLGVLTLIYFVPVSLALIHQFGAILLLSCLLWAYFLIKSCSDI